MTGTSGVVGGLQGTNMDFVTSLQVQLYLVLILFIFVYLSCQSLAGLGSEKDEEDMSYQEKKALEKKR